MDEAQIAGSRAAPPGDSGPDGWLQPTPASSDTEDGGAAPQKPAAHEVDAHLVGNRLRSFRKRNGLTIRQLAARLEVSPSMISQIETGKTQPSVRTLYAIVNELSVSLDELFVPEGAGARSGRTPVEGVAANVPDSRPAVSRRNRVQRAGQRQVLELESGVKWELLATSHEPDMDFIHHIYAPGGSSSPPGVLMRHTGREFGIVLRGRLGVTVGFDEYVLLPGDSILFDSTTPHRLHNEGDEEVHSIWMIYGRNP